MSKKIEILGQEINGLKVIEENVSCKGNYNYYLKIICHCGETFIQRKDRFIKSNRMSCGCLDAPKVNTKDIDEMNLFNRYSAIKQRCNNEKCAAYKDYGARGIKLCEEWSGNLGFYNFKEWSKLSGYHKNLTIERINVDGNYEPTNCKWATRKEQSLNKRNNFYAKLYGKRVKVNDIANEFNLNIKSLSQRKYLGRNEDDLFNGLKCWLSQKEKLSNKL